MRSYSERLRVPVSWWLLSIPTIAVLGAEIFAYANMRGMGPAVVYIVFTAVVGGFLLAWGATSIKVTDGVLQAGGDALSLEYVGEVAALDEKQSARLRGPRGDPTAHLLLRPYLKRTVYISVTDTGSSHPYWLIATRHPDELAAAIESCRQPSGSFTG
ncbi:MAG: DUF3093 domain-containing protein [Streptosporangiaceae bacterium]|jgi:hypothetical protein